MMGILVDYLTGLPSMAQPTQQGFDFQFMAAQRMAYGYEPINWKKILLNQLRAESYGRQLNECEQFLFDSLVKDAQDEAP